MLRGLRRLAVSSLLTRGGGGLGQHRSLQLHAGPHFGYARLRWQLWGLRWCRRPWRFRHGRGSGHFRRGHLYPRHLCPGHLCRRHRWLGRRRHMRQSVFLALDFVSLDRRLAQFLHMHGRRRWRSRSSRRRFRRCSRRPRRSHRDNGRFFLSMIEHDGVLRDWIGDDAAGRRVDARFAVTRTPQARRRLGRRSAPGRLRLGGALGTRRRRRRR
jgi:hypothetical protein